MKIAIPIFGSRVSPRFDCAQAFLLITVDAGRVMERQELAAAEWAPHERIKRLVEQGTNVVICGGIDWLSVESLQRAGITVCRGVSGEVESALATLLRGEMSSATMAGLTERTT
jgi:predicted Fe-Mo cluster-binding NifX family protein